MDVKREHTDVIDLNTGNRIEKKDRKVHHGV